MSDNNNFELIPIEILLRNRSIGFRIIPIDINSKTPAIKSTNEIYDNPNYWTAQKLKQEHHRFRNVATTFGKTHIKDVNGEDLYLHGLDIDSDNALGILFDLLEELKTKTYVTKTKKDCGYHAYWLSHKQHPPIGTTKCRSGYEFEIKSDNSLGLCTLPPSTHRDDPKFRYQSIGQEKIVIDDTLYDRILDLVTNECLIQSDLNGKPGDYNDNGKAIRSDSGSVYRILQDDEIEQIISYVRASYDKGFRHDLVFGLSGLLFKNKISLLSARQLISTLCDFTHDEEKASRLQVLDNTYLKGLDGQEIKGISQLQKVLARIHGGNGDSEEDYSGQILESINEVLNRGHEQKRNNNSSNNHSTSTQTLIQLAKQNTTLSFKDRYGIAYAKIKVAAHGEIIAVESTKFEYYLSKLFYDFTGGKIAGQESLNNAIRVLLAETLFEGLTIDLSLRVAWGKKKGEELYYDLADTEWRCIKVIGKGWEVIQNSPILFTRFNQKSQIEPDRNYHVDIFDKYLDLMHINNPEHRLLIKVWTVAAFIPDIPHPINIPYGEKGSVKTTFCRFQKRLIDPDKIELLTVPQDKSEFVQQQYHNYLTVYDNIKSIPYWFSDEVCKAITGVGSSKRKLYTNDEDVIYSYKRCLIINGINNSLTEPDALDRSILTEFERIPDE
ncbi:MAG TPA: hypothetical protein VKA95_17805, partial [Nitrososphaeraceae archaeon]|nr:hypothetical protein [Nitrososphaeraceae archaeon]